MTNFINFMIVFYEVWVVVVHVICLFNLNMEDFLETNFSRYIRLTRPVVDYLFTKFMILGALKSNFRCFCFTGKVLSRPKEMSKISRAVAKTSRAPSGLN